MDMQKRIEELEKQKIEIEKELKMLKGMECREGRVVIYKSKIPDYISARENITLGGWVYTLGINRISEYNPTDNRKVGVFFSYNLKEMPSYIKNLIDDLTIVLERLERGEFNFE